MPFSTMPESAFENDHVLVVSRPAPEIETHLEMSEDTCDLEAPIVQSVDGTDLDLFEDDDLFEDVPDADELLPENIHGPTSAFYHRAGAPKIPALIARSQLTKPQEQIAIASYTPPRFASIIPPPNFGAVIKGKVYRSGFPSTENLEFLESLGLRTILTLVEAPHPEAYTEWIRYNFKVHHTIPLPANKETVCIKTRDMAKVMAIVTDPDNYPMLIHCNKGKHRTGCVVGAFRKCAGVPISSIISEYHDYASNKARKLDETFLENVRPFELMHPLPPADVDKAGNQTIIPHRAYYAALGGWFPTITAKIAAK